MTDNPDIVREPVIAGGASYLDWGAALGGALVAVAALFIFVSFGSAVGLGVIAPWEGDAFDPTAVGLMAAGWFLFSAAMAYYCGGYIAGRMRGIWGDATASEVETRDALHGAVVWAVGILVFAWIGSATVTSVATGAAKITGATANAVGAAIQSDAAGNLADYTVDKLYRTDAVKLGEPSSDFRRQSAIILYRAVADGELTADDKQYLIRLVQRHTSLNEEEATARVNQVFAEARAAAVKLKTAAKEAAEAAQTATLLLGLLIAVGFVISLAAAWFGAILGGSHRNDNTVSWVFAARRSS